MSHVHFCCIVLLKIPSSISCTFQILHGMAQSSDEPRVIQSIKSREGTFCCPLHSCDYCHQSEMQPRAESRQSRQLEEKIVRCRRCPRMYHSGCLPKLLPCSLSSDPARPQRVWGVLKGENLQPLMYCQSHEFDEDLGLRQGFSVGS